MSGETRKAIVTGGAGFIGSHLVDRLLGEGCCVVVLDNFSTGRPENLAHLKDNKYLDIIKVDMTDLCAIKPYFKGIDYVFHLAALADIVPSITNPADYYRSNVDGTFKVLEASRAHDVRKIVYAASSSCYGIPDVYPTPESAEIRPQYPYALTKYLGEQLVMHWGWVYKLPATSLRLFNVYGPRSRTSGTYGAVFGVFLAQKLNNKPFTVVGDGTQTRDFVFVSDVVDAFFKAAISDCKDEIMNVGSGGTYSVKRLTELLKGDVIHISKRPGEPGSTFADIKKIGRLLGWRPRISFEEGVKSVLDNMEYWRNAPAWTADKIELVTKDWFKYLSR